MDVLSLVKLYSNGTIPPLNDTQSQIQLDHYNRLTSLIPTIPLLSLTLDLPFFTFGLHISRYKQNKVPIYFTFTMDNITTDRTKYRARKRLQEHPKRSTSLTVGALHVTRAQNVHEQVVPGTVFISYHGEGHPYGRTFSDANENPDVSMMDEVSLAAYRLREEVLKDNKGPIVPRVGLPVRESTTILTPSELDDMVETPTFDLGRPYDGMIDPSRPFPRPRALALEDKLRRYIFREVPKSEEWRNQDLRKWCSVPFTNPGYPPEDVDAEYRKFHAAQAQEAMSRGRPAFVDRPKKRRRLDSAPPGWSTTDVEHFFEVLGRVGRHRLADVAKSMGKGLAEVEEYNDRLFEASEALKVAYRSRVQAGEEFIPENRIPVSYIEIPAAHEMSEAWLAMEESFARDLQDADNAEPMNMGEKPFESVVDTGDLSEDEEPGEYVTQIDHERLKHFKRRLKKAIAADSGELINTKAMFKLASRLFYRCPANGMDIQSQEYNHDLPKLEGIDGDIVKLLSVLVVQKTRELLLNMNFCPHKELLENRVRPMLSLAGHRYRTLDRFFEGYPDRSGAELLAKNYNPNEPFVTELQGYGSWKNMTTRHSNDWKPLKTWTMTNTSLFDVSLKLNKRNERPKFLTVDEQKRVDGVMREKMKYEEGLEDGDDELVVSEEEEEEEEEEIDIAAELEQPSADADHLYPLRGDIQLPLVCYLHEEEMHKLDAYDEQQRLLAESTLTALLFKSAPFQFRNVQGQLLRFNHELDKQEEKAFEKQQKRYQYDQNGHEIPLWQREMPEARDSAEQANPKVPRHDPHPPAGRGPGWGLKQREQAEPGPEQEFDQESLLPDGTPLGYWHRVKVKDADTGKINTVDVGDGLWKVKPEDTIVSGREKETAEQIVKNMLRFERILPTSHYTVYGDEHDERYEE